MTLRSRALPFFLTAAFFASGCATALVSSKGTSETSNQAQVVEKEMSASWDRGMKKAPLSREAEEIFQAMRTLPLGFSAAMDLDELVRSGIFEERALDPKGYSLVQLISPYVSEASTLKSQLGRPLAEAAVLATLLDKTLESYDVKRMGAIWVPADPENVLQSVLRNPMRETVFILGTDISAEDSVVPVETALNAVLSVSKLSEEKLAQEVLAPNSSPGTDGADEEANGVSDDSSDESRPSILPKFSLAGGVFCIGSSNASSASKEGKLPVEPYCMTSGNGYVAVGRESPLKRTLAVLRSAEPPSTANAENPSRRTVEFGYIHMFLPSMGLMELSVIPDITGDMHLSLKGDFSSEERAQEVTQMVELGIARRTQSKREFMSSVAETIEQMRELMASMEGIPKKMIQVASEMTPASVTDPHGVGLGAPENLVFQKDGKRLELTIKFPAQHIDHLIATLRNVRAVRYQVLIGSFSALSSFVEKSKALREATTSDETVAPDATAEEAATPAAHP